MSNLSIPIATAPQGSLWLEAATRLRPLGRVVAEAGGRGHPYNKRVNISHWVPLTLVDFQ